MAHSLKIIIENCDSSGGDYKMTDDNNQHTKRAEILNNELESTSKLMSFTPDEEDYPVKDMLKALDEDQEEDEMEQDNAAEFKKDTREKKGLQADAKGNQEQTDEKTYSENIKHQTDKDYSQNNETYDKNNNISGIQDSKLNPDTETQFQAPDPDEPKKSKQKAENLKGSGNKMKNKNQPL